MPSTDDWTAEKEEWGRAITEALYRRGMIRTWLRDRPEGWTLISGLWSPVYIQLRPLCSHPDLLAEVGRALDALVRNEAPHVTRLVGIAMAGVPIATAASLAGGMPMAFTRKLEGVRRIEEVAAAIAGYGDHSLVEGEMDGGDAIACVDDLVTRFDSKRIAAALVAHEAERRGLGHVDCADVAVLLDREQGAAAAAAEAGMRLHAVIPLRSRGLEWLTGAMAPEEIEVIAEYLDDPAPYQEESRRDKLISMARSRAGIKK